jgi:hypothetical protein
MWAESLNYLTRKVDHFKQLSVNTFPRHTKHATAATDMHTALEEL